MHCRNCGKEVNDKAEICLSCGVRPLLESNYCQECGVETKSNQEICIKCGVRLQSTQGTQFREKEKIITDFSGLSSYYQEEFRKIGESNESYRGKFNWAAFLFTIIWALTKGLWLTSVVWFLAIIITAGVAAIPCWFVIGFRGNYIYYNAYAKDKQIPT